MRTEFEQRVEKGRELLRCRFTAGMLPADYDLDKAIRGMIEPIKATKGRTLEDVQLEIEALMAQEADT